MLQALDVSAGVFVRGLTNLKTLLTKGEAHGTKVTASLVEGMQDLAAQVHSAQFGIPAWSATIRRTLRFDNRLLSRP
jgi:hypothetical protein